MNLLLDTCTFLWIALDPSQLSPQALVLFQVKVPSLTSFMHPAAEGLGE